LTNKHNSEIILNSSCVSFYSLIYIPTSSAPLIDMGFETWQGLDIFLFCATCRPPLGSTKPLFSGYRGSTPESVVGNSTPSASEVGMSAAVTILLLHPVWVHMTWPLT